MLTKRQDILLGSILRVGYYNAYHSENMLLHRDMGSYSELFCGSKELPRCRCYPLLPRCI
jgi:hypothetical protein